MGDYPSKPSHSNPSSTAAAASSRTMTLSNSLQTHQSEPERDPTHLSETTESESPTQETKENPADKETLPEKVSEDSVEEGEEEGECGFCLFMKAGGCRDTFTEWEKCVEEGEKNKEDIVEKCFQATAALKKCMEAHSDYYAPLLQAEEEALKQLEEEKERSDNQEMGGDESTEKVKEGTLEDSEKKETS